MKFKSPAVRKVVEEIGHLFHPQYPFLDKEYSPGSLMPVCDLTLYVRDMLFSGDKAGVAEVWSYLTDRYDDRNLSGLLRMKMPDGLVIDDLAKAELLAELMLSVRSFGIHNAGEIAASTLACFDFSLSAGLRAAIETDVLANVDARCSDDEPEDSSTVIGRVDAAVAMSVSGFADAARLMSSVPPMVRATILYQLQYGESGDSYHKRLHFSNGYDDRRYGCSECLGREIAAGLDIFELYPIKKKSLSRSVTKQALCEALDAAGIEYKKSSSREDLIELACGVEGLLESLVSQYDPDLKRVKAVYREQFLRWKDRVIALRPLARALLDCVHRGVDLDTMVPVKKLRPRLPDFSSQPVPESSTSATSRAIDAKFGKIIALAKQMIMAQYHKVVDDAVPHLADLYLKLGANSRDNADAWGAGVLAVVAGEIAHTLELIPPSRLCYTRVCGYERFSKRYSLPEATLNRCGEKAVAVSRAIGSICGHQDGFLSAALDAYAKAAPIIETLSQEEIEDIVSNRIDPASSESEGREYARKLALAAVNGNTTAAYLLAVIHREGMFGMYDLAVGEALLIFAAKAGDVNAMHDLAVDSLQVARRFKDSRHREFDEKIALSRFESCAEMKDYESMSILGVLYATGECVKKDESKAVTLWTRAMEGGDPQAGFNLGMWQLSHGQQGDVEAGGRAQSAFVVAARGGRPEAMFNLAQGYLHGHMDQLPVQENYVHGLCWLKRANEAGMPGCDTAWAECYNAEMIPMGVFLPLAYELEVPVDDSAMMSFRRAWEAGRVGLSVSYVNRDNTVPLCDRQTVLAALRQGLAQDQGVVEVDACEGADGWQGVYWVTKRHLEPSGVAYELKMYLMKGDAVWCIEGIFEESGMTGQRECAVLELLRRSGEVKSGPEGLEGWFADPYDATVTSGCLACKAEDRRFDEVFPWHVLSVCRGLIRTMLGR